MYCVFKFNEGEDYSQYCIITNGFKIAGGHPVLGLSRPIALRDGYYLSNIITESYDVKRYTYLNFTYDEYEAGMIPENWDWKDYTLVDCPYAEFYSVSFDGCDYEKADVPGFCQSCDETFYVDTVWLNAAISAKIFFSLDMVKRMI